MNLANYVQGEETILPTFNRLVPLRLIDKPYIGRHGFVRRSWTLKYVFTTILSKGLTGTEVVVLHSTFTGEKGAGHWELNPGHCPYFEILCHVHAS